MVGALGGTLLNNVPEDDGLLYEDIGLKASQRAAVQLRGSLACYGCDSRKRYFWEQLG